MRRRTEEGVRAPGRSVWQAGVIRARGISAVWPGPAGDACAGGGRRTFLGEQDCLHLGESVGRLPVQLPELTVSWIHLSRYVNYAQIFKKSAPPAQDTSPAWHSAGCPSGRALQSAGRHTCGGADGPLDMVPRAAL